MIKCVDVLGPGPLGAPGPRCRIRVVQVTTYCQASYLLSGMHPNVAAYFAPNNRIQTTYCQAKLPTVRQAFSRYETCTQQPHTLHPNVSADLHPTTAYMHPNVAAYMHPKGAYFAPKSSRIHAPKSYTYIFYSTTNLSIMLTYICLLNI